MAERKRTSLLWGVERLLPKPADYRELPTSWPRDILAGITVGIVALPLALAFAISSGAAPEMGLITAIIAGFVAAVFGGSHVQVSGPTGAMVVILAPIAATHGMIALPIVAVMGGMIVIVAGFFRLGRTVSFIPWPVIEGFTLGIAVIIFMQQVPSALGVEPGPSLNALVAAIQSLSGVRPTDALLGLVCVAIVVASMTLLPKIHPRIPGSIIAIILVTIVVDLAGWNLARIGELPTSLPMPHAPPLDPDMLRSLIGPAFAVAALTAIESLLSARVASGMTTAGTYDGDRELVGQGLAGIASGLFGGMPATGAIARTAVSVRSGARTRVAAIVHALFLTAVVYFATDLVGRIPMVALAGVLMMTAVGMVDRRTAGDIIGTSRSDAFLFVVTALITVSFDLIWAVAIGIAIAAVFSLRAMSLNSVVHREELPGEAEPGDERIALIEFDGSLFFGIGDRILTSLDDVDEVDVVILRLSHLRFMDSSGARVLSELVKTFGRRRITVIVKGIQARHQRLTDRTGVLSSLQPDDYVIASMPDAVNQARQIVREREAERAAAAQEGAAV
ncbi:SulP family inorganic anion transporter [Helcobacillus massiliensis]|uniref:SulP family sulfate permease n=1 Tax=Helcobacillus massiliensis TaxID=521392 RepID=A0A839QWI6_9MICO|nr:SulP family inorganic anion transporter [Helcobacillus massiliensis]MBB3023998.1 SulP family sulfate permease [Helcobacillus massiliensis]MBB3024077.1 SulP family sulfate permease [Helcobacillus massiliensis]